MAIERIDADLCIGCGICVNSCSMDVIRMNKESHKAMIVYPNDCVLCNFCEQDCPQNAIYISQSYYSPVLTSFGS